MITFIVGKVYWETSNNFYLQKKKKNDGRICHIKKTTSIVVSEGLRKVGNEVELEDI